MLQLHELLDRTAQISPERAALRYREREVSFGELRESAASAAGALLALGIGRGDRVALYLPNRIEFVQLAFACSRIGAVFVPVNPMLKGRQLAHILRDSGARCIVMSGAMLDASSRAMLDSDDLQVLMTIDMAKPPQSALQRFRHMTFEQALAHSAPVLPAGTVDSDVAAILYTSGSTGAARGVIVSHRNLVSGAACVAQYLEGRPDDRVLAALPLSFDYGLNQVLTSVQVGACCVLTNYSTPQALLQVLAAERITGLAGVPTMWAQLAAAEWPPGVARELRYITNSGGALPPPVLRRLIERLPGAKIFCMYGLTEAFRSTYLDPALLAQRPGSIGKAVPGQEVLVLREDGLQCVPGEMGELVHRGSFVSLGYWNNPEQTRLRFRPLPGDRDANPEIVVWSGDLVRADDDGYLYFVGRRDGLIKTSGYRVSPTEVEEVVADVPGVVEAVAMGIFDEVVGQRIVVAVVARPDSAAALADRVGQQCRLQLPAYMVPAQVHVLDSLPLGPTGKPDRAAIAGLLLQARRGSS